jgi:hypothetical protein
VNAADSFEFARRAARGKLVILPGDDDVLIATALERFRQEHVATGAEFLFCCRAEYRDRNFPGPGRNTLDCPAFQGSSQGITVEEFLGPTFQWAPRFDWHPSAFVFAQDLADRIAARCGRFFQCNGVEFCAWSLAAVFTNRIAYVDAPLTICGRTGQSWGSHMVVGRSSRKRMRKLVADFEGPYKYAPLSRFTMSNHRAEGYLTAKHLFPDMFSQFEFNWRRYLLGALKELRERESRGVAAGQEIEELKSYVARAHPHLLDELNRDERARQEARRRTVWHQMRGAIGDRGLRHVRDQLAERRLARERTQLGAARVRAGQTRNGFMVAGKDVGFHDILGSADFLGRIVAEGPSSELAGAARREPRESVGGRS